MPTRDYLARRLPRTPTNLGPSGPGFGSGSAAGSGAAGRRLQVCEEGGRPTHEVGRDEVPRLVVDGRPVLGDVLHGGPGPGWTYPGVEATKIRAKRPAPAAYISPVTGHASWARKAAMGATSSGAMAATPRSPPPPAPLPRSPFPPGRRDSRLVAPAAGSTRHARHGRRRDEVDPDPVLGARHRQAAGQTDDGSLGRGVRHVVGQPEHAAGGRHHDPAVARPRPCAARRLARC